MTHVSSEVPMEVQVTGMVRRFRQIGETTMRDLPFYNHALAVEAVDFQPLGDDQWIGVLVTPWFMNVIVLPRRMRPLDEAVIGQRIDEDVPVGRRRFLLAGDAVIGQYKMLSLHSPMNGFRFQEFARIEARKCLRALLAPPHDPEDEAAAAEARRPAMGRRAFLSGRGVVCGGE